MIIKTADLIPEKRRPVVYGDFTEATRRVEQILSLFGVDYTMILHHDYLRTPCLVFCGLSIDGPGKINQVIEFAKAFRKKDQLTLGYLYGDLGPETEEVMRLLDKQGIDFTLVLKHDCKIVPTLETQNSFLVGLPLIKSCFGDSS